jgi:hypothetical protein
MAFDNGAALPKGHRTEWITSSSDGVVWMTIDEWRWFASTLTVRLPIAAVRGRRVVLRDVFNTDEWMRANGYTTDRWRR